MEMEGLMNAYTIIAPTQAIADDVKQTLDLEEGTPLVDGGQCWDLPLEDPSPVQDTDAIVVKRSKTDTLSTVLDAKGYEAKREEP